MTHVDILSNTELAVLLIVLLIVSSMEVMSGTGAPEACRGRKR
jgi:hypothetical protein